jgi:hypothetical protein
MDSTRLQGAVSSVRIGDAGNTSIPSVDIPVVQRISDWIRGKLREVRQIFSGQGKQETKGTIVERNRRPETPVVYRKHE